MCALFTQLALLRSFNAIYDFIEATCLNCQLPRCQYGVQTVINDYNLKHFVEKQNKNKQKNTQKQKIPLIYWLDLDQAQFLLFQYFNWTQRIFSISLFVCLPSENRATKQFRPWARKLLPNQWLLCLLQMLQMSAVFGRILAPLSTAYLNLVRKCLEWSCHCYHNFQLLHCKRIRPFQRHSSQCIYRCQHRLMLHLWWLIRQNRRHQVSARFGDLAVCECHCDTNSHLKCSQNTTI